MRVARFTLARSLRFNCPAVESRFASVEFPRTLQARTVRATWWSFLKTDRIIRTRNNSLTLTPLELDIMKAVWKRNPTTVKEVQIAIRPARPLAYTTVMTVMHRLFLKGFLQRARLSRTDYYEPAVEFSDVRDAAVSGVIHHFFKGSRDEFLHFLGNDVAPAEAVGAIPGPAALDETLL